MTQEEINKVAKEYKANETKKALHMVREPDIYEMKMKAFSAEEIEAAFKAGSFWRINSVWHTTADMPEKYKLCLVGYKDPDGENKTRTDWRNEYEWVCMCHYDTILRWAYVSDLLPEGGAQ